MKAVRSPELARQLKALLRDSGFSARALARMIGRSHGHLNDVLNGKADISQDVLMDIARALGGDVAALRAMWVDASRNQQRWALPGG